MLYPLSYGACCIQFARKDTPKRILFATISHTAFALPEFGCKKCLRPDEAQA